MSKIIPLLFFHCLHLLATQALLGVEFGLQSSSYLGGISDLAEVSGMVYQSDGTLTPLPCNATLVYCLKQWSLIRPN